MKMYRAPDWATVSLDVIFSDRHFVFVENRASDEKCIELCLKPLSELENSQDILMLSFYIRHTECPLMKLIGMNIRRIR